MKSLTIEVDKHIENTFMPYAMMTILDRALPDVRDGMKPVHRRVLYSMFDKGRTYNKDMVKSAGIVSDTMNIHFHGDSSIYEALALMTDRNETLLHPYINADGGFGKVYNTDKPAAYRYTYCRLNKFSEELFRGLDKNIVDYVEEGGFKQPLVLPVSYPNILIKPNNGISVGEACNFPSFNMNEVIDATINVLNGEDGNIFLYPDFSTGGEIVSNVNEIVKLNNTGLASIQIRGSYKFNQEYSCIEVYEIPYNTTTTQIVSKITDIIKSNKYKDILDVRDETGFDDVLECDVLKIAIDIKKKANPNIIMAWLFKNSPLQSSFSANMNCLVNGTPKVLGTKQLIQEWIKFRKQCLKRELQYDIQQLQTVQNELLGLQTILQDLDEAISLIRSSKTEKESIEKLREHFNLNDKQLEYIVKIRMVNMNQEWLTSKINKLTEVNEQLKVNMDNLESDSYYVSTIISQLQDVKKKYGQPRRTTVIQPEETISIKENELIEDYNCQIVLTKEGYLKKTLRYSDNQKLKDGDTVLQQIVATNKSKLLFFTDKVGCYYLNTWEIDSTQPSNLGNFLPSLLQLQDEKVLYVVPTVDFKGHIMFAFENGKVAKIPLSSYETKTNRSKVINAYNVDSKLVSINYIDKDMDFMAVSSIDKVLVVNTYQINAKASKTSQGIQLLKSKNNSVMVEFKPVDIDNVEYYRGSPNQIGKYLIS